MCWICGDLDLLKPQKHPEQQEPLKMLIGFQIYLEKKELSMQWSMMIGFPIIQTTGFVQAN
jgi:hypothetical protein